MDSTVFRFGRCEVNLERREVLVDGERRSVEPRPFALLVHLLAHHHRVVTKDELLDTVWPDEAVSDGSLARAVMKARQAIGDDGAPVLIKTVHRVGYRFVAPLSPGDSAAAAPSDDTPGEGEPVMQIALLPFENLTGEPSLDWVRLGLMVLVNGALVHDQRVSPVSTSSLLAALDSLPADADRTARSAAVQRLTGARHVAGVTIARDASGYRVDLRLLTAPQAPVRRLRAGEPTVLGDRLAREVMAALFPGAARLVSIGFDFADPLANQAFAQAEQAVAEQKWPQAIQLLKVVRILEPDSGTVRLEHLRALAAHGEAEAVSVGQRLLARAEAGHDALLVCAVHQALGRAHLNQAAFAAARSHLDQALLLSGGRQPQDWTAQTLLLRAAVALHERDVAQAEGRLDQLRRLCERNGNRIFPLAATLLHAAIAASRGDVVQSLRLSREGVQRAREQRLHRSLAQACGSAASACMTLGLLQEAAAFAEEGLATALRLGDGLAACGLAAGLCLAYRASNAPQEAARVLAAIAPAVPPLAPLAREALLRAQGHHAAAAGEHGAAAGHFRAALSLARGTKATLQEHETLPWLIRSLIQAGHADEASDELARAAGAAQAGNAELQAGLRHGAALQAHAAGRVDTALHGLQQVADAPGPVVGLWHACACVDTAWLLAEAGRVDAARQQLARLGAPFRDHRMARAAQARLQSTIAPAPTPVLPPPGLPSCL